MKEDNANYLFCLVRKPHISFMHSKNKGGIWSNAGITQFHLPEDTMAQTLDGIITLAYDSKSSLELIEDSLRNVPSILQEQSSLFSWNKLHDNELNIVDPWGSKFRLIVDKDLQDSRGLQPIIPSSLILPCTISDICIDIPKSANIDGIGRFYNSILGAPILPTADSFNEIKIITSPYQTLTFKKVNHDKLLNNAVLKTDEEGLANYGPHISLYVADFLRTYDLVTSVKSDFVNHRFKRRAYNKGKSILQWYYFVGKCINLN